MCLRSIHNSREGISNRQIFLWLVSPKINLSVIGSLLWIYHCITEQWLRHTFCGSKLAQILFTTKLTFCHKVRVHPENWTLKERSRFFIKDSKRKHNKYLFQNQPHIKLLNWNKCISSDLSLNEKKFVQFPAKFIKLCNF